MKTRTQLGDTWSIGPHKIFVGDGLKCIGDIKVACVFTDPPYKFQATRGKGSLFSKKMNKHMETLSDIHLTEFNPSEFLSVLPSLFTKNYHCSMIFTNKELLPDYLWWARQNKVFYNVLVWKKPNPMPIGCSHYSDIEYLLYFRKNSTFNNEDTYPGANRNRCLEYNKVIGINHPTVKPVALIENQIRLITKENQLVYDPYLGSGSTMIACINSNRVCYGAEILPEFADLALSRVEEAYGEKGVRYG